MIGIIILLFRGMWTLGIWIRKAVEYFNWGLMSNPSRNMEDSDGEGDLNSENLAQEISEEKTNILMIYWLRMWLLFALVQKNICRG